MIEKYITRNIFVDVMKKLLQDLQLSDPELVCFLKFALVLDDTVGGQNDFLGTDTHPILSPSRARANSNMNFPSKNTSNIRYVLKTRKTLF